MIMNSITQLIKKTILAQPANKVFYASSFYHHHFPDLSEVNYYKVIERMIKRRELIKLGKGIFVIPSKRPLSQPQGEAFKLKLLLNRKSYLEVGYGLFNRLGLSTQISKNRYFYVNKLMKPVQKVNHFYFIRKNINFQKNNIKESIELLEVLQNYQKTQDLSMNALLHYIQKSLKTIHLETFQYVITHMKYKKSTIAFLNRLLETYAGLKNPLGSHLSQVSKYKIPSLGDSFETTLTH
jgi:hypothetical protein